MPEGNEQDPKTGTSTEGGKSGEASQTPPWGDDFDAERAWSLVKNLRTEVAGLKTERDEARSERDEFRTAAEKSGEERDQALAAATKRAEDAERTLAIRKHNLPDDVVEEFADYLTGTPEEVDAKAARLAARIAKPAEKTEGEGDEGGESGEPGEGGDKGLPSRPQPRLVPGSARDGGESSATDLGAIVAKARARL